MPMTPEHDEAVPLIDQSGVGSGVSRSQDPETGAKDPETGAKEPKAPEDADVSDDEEEVGELLRSDKDSKYFSALTYLKCIVLTLVSTYPFFGVVQTLSALTPQEFEPCTNKPCNYVRLFKDQNFPGTGTRVIQVQNGYEPIYLSNVHKFSSNLTVTVGGAAEANETPFEELPKRTQELIVKEREVLGNLSRPHQIGLFMSHWTHRVLASPVLALSGRMKKPNFTAIPSGVCNKSYEETIALCDKDDTKKAIQNTLPKGAAKTLYIVCVWSWALFKILHDCFLMSSNDVNIRNRKWNLKQYAMPLGILSCWMQLFAAGIGFFWSAGAVAVFVAKPDSCTCFYRLPELEALVGVATPLYLLFLGLCKVDSLALSFAYGDYLYFQTYDVPYRVVRRTPYWYTASLVAEKVGGNETIKEGSGNTNDLMTIKEGRVIQSRMLQGLMTVFPFMFLAPASCGITLRVLEWLKSLGSSQILAPEMKAVFFCVMWVPFVLTALSAFFLVLDGIPHVGSFYVPRMLRAFFVKVYGVQWMYLFQRVLDPNGVKLHNMTEDDIKTPAKVLSVLTQLIVFPLCVYLFLCYVFSFLPLAYVGAALCLIPTAVTAGYSNSLVQAELWAAGGFVFVFSLWFVLAALLVPDVVEIEGKLIDARKDVVFMDEGEVRDDLEKRGAPKCLAHCFTPYSPKPDGNTKTDGDTRTGQLATNEVAA